MTPTTTTDTARSVLTGRDGPVATLVLNRPWALNALTAEARDTLMGDLRAAAEDPSVGAVVLSGAGRAFCTGQDIREMLDHAHRTTDFIHEILTTSYGPLALQLHHSPIPVIAAINGAAAGAGLGLALACQHRIAADSAHLHTAFAKLGLAADTGVSWTLPRLVGAGRAAELLMLGEPVTAERAATIGMVDRVVPANRLATEAACWARHLATRPVHGRQP